MAKNKADIARLHPDPESFQLVENMMDQIMLVCGTGPMETWEILGIWHISKRDEAEERLEWFKQLGRDLDLGDVSDLS